uniref:Tr-type G domain-containing protein n=2 Tax=Corethron hystrix TaxID=216773 RepID=A0A7S1FUM3_9STRA
MIPLPPSANSGDFHSGGREGRGGGRGRGWRNIYADDEESRFSHQGERGYGRGPSGSQGRGRGRGRHGQQSYNQDRRRDGPPSEYFQSHQSNNHNNVHYQKNRGRSERYSNAPGAIINDEIGGPPLPPRKKKAAPVPPVESERKTITLPFDYPISVRSFAHDLLRIKPAALLSVLDQLGEDTDAADGEPVINDMDVAELVCLELGFDAVRSRPSAIERRSLTATRPSETMASAGTPRPPVVSIMGHVDHGKTTLMDALRQRAGVTKQAKTVRGNVAGSEAGGITQTLSAFQLTMSSDEENNAITILDTPGHAAFKAMRAHGGIATDVIVMVIAADDGVAAQTHEIIEMAREGGQAMVVALTKVDREDVDVEEARNRIINELMTAGVLCEEVGGDVQVVPVSGVTGEGLDDLVERLLLQAEVMDLRADGTGTGEAVVIDARQEKGLGVVADCIVRWGTVRPGDAFVTGVIGGKIRILNGVDGKPLKEATPSTPVRIIGLKSLPRAGDDLFCVANEKKARDIADRRSIRHTEELTRHAARAAAVAPAPALQITGTAAKNTFMTNTARTKYNKLHGMDQAETEEKIDRIRAPVVLRSDAEGTLAAVRESLMAVAEESSHDIDVDVVSLGVGPVTASDVLLASEADAAIFAFGVRAGDQSVTRSAEREGVRIRHHTVIYSLLDDARKILARHLPPVMVERVAGRANVQAVFEMNVNGTKKGKMAEMIAGCRVESGSLFLDKDGNGTLTNYRVIRKGEIICEEVKAMSIRKFKDEVIEAKNGDECGVGLKGFSEFKEGDIIECFSRESKQMFV